MTEDELKRAKEVLKGLQSEDKYDYANEALDIIYTHGEYSEFMSEDMLDEMTKREAESGAVRVMYFLADAQPYAPYGYMLDGYGNARNVELDDIECELDGIIKNNE